MNVGTNIPVLFQKLNTYEIEDTRFMKVKIWLMHLEENFNGSYFSKPVVESAIPSLANTPILVYMEENNLGENDFSDHRMELVKEDGKFKIKYLCSAIGLIPESNNAKFETRLCDDGKEREFLTVEGLVWRKWDDPIDIFNRDTIKNQSMELHDDYTGKWGDDKLFHFTSFKFFGACGLGKDVSPAMINSTIEVQFNNDSIFSEIQSKMEQFKHFTSTSSSIEVDINNETQGGTKVDEILKMLESYSLTLEDLQAKGINHDEYSLEELEEKVKSEFTDANPNDDKDEKPEDKFALTVSQLQEEAYRSLADFGEIVDEYWGYSYPKYGLVDLDTDNKFVVAYDYENWYLVGFSYELEGDKLNVNKDSMKRFKVSYSPMELDQTVPNMFDLVKAQFTKAQEVFSNFKSETETKLTEKENELTSLNEQFTTVKTELESTLEKYSAKIQEEREEQENQIFSAFAKELTEDEMKVVKDSKDSLTLDEIQDKLFALVGKKKAKFNLVADQKPQVIDLEIDANKKSKTGKSYDDLFEKHGK